jgi:hypothetical protein
MKEIVQQQPLTILILQDWSRLFAQTNKEQILSDSLKKEFLNINWNIISTVKWNIRTIRDATDAEYYEFFILDKLPFEVMEKMHSSLTKINENNTKVSLLSLLNHQRTIEDELRMEKWVLTPEEKENWRHIVMRMNDILVKKWVIKKEDADRIINKILSNKL